MDDLCEQDTAATLMLLNYVSLKRKRNRSLYVEGSTVIQPDTIAWPIIVRDRTHFSTPQLQKVKAEIKPIFPEFSLFSTNIYASSLYSVIDASYVMR